MTDAPTTLNLDGLSELLAKATPGPWRVYGDESDWLGIEAPETTVVCWAGKDEFWEGEPTLGGVRGTEPNEEDAESNAALIVALRNNGEALIAEVRRLREEVGAAEAQRDEAREALRAIVDRSSVGKPGSMALRSRYCSYPAQLHHRARAVIEGHKP